MNIRGFLFITALGFLTNSNIFADGEVNYYKLSAEPIIRIGLSTNSGSVSITTGDVSLVAASPDEPSKMLATTRVTVSARAYRQIGRAHV